MHHIDGGSEGGRRTVEAIEAMDHYLAERTAEVPRAGLSPMSSNGQDAVWPAPG